jgi:hypothetical protein
MTTDDPDARAAIQAGSSEPCSPEAYREHPGEGAGPQDGRDHEPQPGQMHPVDKAFYRLAIKERDYERARVDRLQSHLQRALRRIDVLREAELAATAEAVALQRELEAFRKRAGFRLPVGDGPQRFVYGDENTIEWLRRELEWLAYYREEGGSMSCDSMRKESES